jgi:hypothetical protein
VAIVDHVQFIQDNCPQVRDRALVNGSIDQPICLGLDLETIIQMALG